MKTKPIILALLTLIAGFFLGMLTSAELRSQRLKPVRVFSSEEKFREGMYSAIQPTENQKVKIDKILDKYSKLNSEAGASFRKEFEERMALFRNELDANITHEQRIRLKELDERRKEMVRERRHKHHNNHSDSLDSSRHD
ncbi:MAG: hypothetical protein LBV26_03555 [Bacteroidales bacterium]|jgi:Spy/CpxP family protein refolding chaperone|nr:hypothetical protein [Bacteroidales bacterium]